MFVVNDFYDPPISMTFITFNNRSKIYFSFTLNLPISFANSLRRILLSEIPSTSLDIVHISENTSVLPDDLIVHRIGLIPVFTHKKLVPFGSCKCQTFCSDCSINCELSVTNDEDSSKINSNESDEIKTVWSSDIVCESAVFPNLMIAKLAKNQKISLTAVGRMNIGKNNAKFSPVNVVEYEYDPGNEQEHTKYWYEENIKKEWPELDKRMERMDKIEGVKLGVEVQDGFDALEIVKTGLQVMRKRFSDLSDMIENYAE